MILFRIAWITRESLVGLFPTYHHSRSFPPHYPTSLSMYPCQRIARLGNSWSNNRPSSDTITWRNRDMSSNLDCLFLKGRDLWVRDTLQDRSSTQRLFSNTWPISSRIQTVVRVGRESTLTVQTSTLLLLSWTRRMNFFPRLSMSAGRKRLNDLTCGHGRKWSMAYERERPMCYHQSAKISLTEIAISGIWVAHSGRNSSCQIPCHETKSQGPTNNILPAQYDMSGLTATKSFFMRPMTSIGLSI